MTRYEKKRLRCRRCVQCENPEANSRRVAKNTVVLYVRMLAVMAIGLFTGRVTFNALGVSDYGLQGIAAGVIGMITFMMGSLSGASSRFIMVELGQGTVGSAKRVFSTVFIVHFLLACLFVVLLETVGLLFLESKLNIHPSRIFAVKWTYHCAVLTTFLSITQVPYSAVIQAHERMSAFAWMTIYDVAVKLGVALAIMRAIKGPDLVIPQHSLDHHDKVKKLKFDVFVVGDDWVGKYDYLEEQGVTVVYTPYGRGASSSSLKKQIAERYERMKKKSDSLIPDDAVEKARTKKRN